MSSCDQDNEGAILSQQSGVSFVNSALGSIAVPASDPTFEVELFRANGNGELTGNLVLETALPDESTLEGCTVTPYTFANGETSTKVKVNVAPLAIGVNLSVTLSLPDDVVSYGGVKSTNVKVNKEYTWVSLGKGTYTDNWGWGKTYDVEILKAEGFDRWRAVAPYAESMINDDGEWGNWLAPSSAEYVEFWLSDGIVMYNPIKVGVYYEGDKSMEIFAYHPLSFSGVDPSYNKQIDDKTFQLAPYYYINGVGGWNYTQYDGVIIITLP